MYRITDIRLRNYRAFATREERVNMPNGQNLLIYGENGSGKSSLSRSLIDFFESSAIETFAFTRNEFLVEEPNGYVTVSFTEYHGNKPKQFAHNFTFGQFGLNSQRDAYNVSFIRKANQSRGFLSYQQLVRSYLIPSAKTQQRPELYELIVDDLLAYHKLPTANRSISEEWESIADGLKEDGRSYKNRTARKKLPGFTSDLSDLLNPIFQETERLLSSYFKHNIELGYQVSVNLNPDNKKQAIGSLKLDVRLFEKGIEQYHYVLNEARLSALAICLYLASIKKSPQPDDFKVLVLDDIFIGLDTSNRFPLLKLLQEEFEYDKDTTGKYVFEDKDSTIMKRNFQIFLTTYDREWFELARQYFSGSNWEYLEMYVGDEISIDEHGHSGVLCDRPVLIPSKGNLEKAQAYFNAKDYPAAGNYLRKEVERLVKERLPLKYRYDESINKEIDKLENLIDQLPKFYADCGCNIFWDASLDKAVKLFKDTVLNPTSHYDLRSPLYRFEIQEAFEMVNRLGELPKITIREILGSGSSLFYKNDALRYEAEYILSESLLSVDVDGRHQHFLECKHKIIYWSKNGARFAKKDGSICNEKEIKGLCEKTIILTERGNRIDDFLGLAKNTTNWQQEFYVKGGQLIVEL